MRRLGQHFLIKKSVLERIVKVLDVRQIDTIVEVGPGHGELTTYIVSARPAKIIAIEKDSRLAEGIRKKELGSMVKVVHGDALKIIPTLLKTYDLKHSSYKIVGNIPYYITGKLLRTLGELEPKPERVVLTIQKEVAERLTAKPPKMNLLAASVGYWGVPQIVQFVPRSAFRPPPKIESAIISITPHPTSLKLRGASKIQPTTAESKAYYTLIKIIFKQPRKTIANNLAEGTNLTKKEVESLLLSLDIKPNLRPQNLSIDTINNLSHNLPPNGL